MAEEKVIEKYYIEVTASGRKKFIHGLLSGLGWGIGVTFGTALFITIISILVSKIDFVPILGQFLADVIRVAQANLANK